MRASPLALALILGTVPLAGIAAADVVPTSCDLAVPVLPVDARASHLGGAPAADWYDHAAPTREAHYQVSQLNLWIDVSLRVYDETCSALLCSDQTALPAKRDAFCSVDHVGEGRYKVVVAAASPADDGNYLITFATGEGDALEHQPRTLDHGDGTCTTYDDRDNDQTPDANEASTTHACPKPKAGHFGESYVVYDDHDDDGQPDEGEVLYATPFDESLVTDHHPRTVDNRNGTCTTWDDVDNDGARDANEPYETYPCPKPRFGHFGESYVLYDDWDEDGQPDAGEVIYATPFDESFVTDHHPRTADNGDGTCTTWDDVDDDGVRDAGEPFANHACPKPKFGHFGDRYVVYDDHDDDGQPDEGEEILATLPDEGDGIPDALEPTLCDHNNTFLDSDGSCAGDDYTPPTADDVLADVEKFLP